jgi:hypothetical protein
MGAWNDFQLAMRVAAAVLAVVVGIGIIGYLLNRSARRHERDLARD